MHKVNVSVPAVCTNIGPGYDVLGLALNLRNSIEMSLSRGEALEVSVQGEGRDDLPDDYHNPVMRAAIKVFQAVEQAPAGLNVRLVNAIPLDVGLSARVTLTVGGLVGANNLLRSPFTHDRLIQMAAELTGQPEAVVAAMRGGLSICAASPGRLVYRTVEVAQFRVVLAVPTLPGFTPRLRKDLPAQVRMSEAVSNLGNAALLVEALRAGDVTLLKPVLRDSLHEPYRRQAIPGYERVVEAAEKAGAHGVVLCGAGPALMAFASYNHPAIESAMQDAFERAGVRARTWRGGVARLGAMIWVVD